MSAIEWTDATWNPVTGCSKVSPGCAHCYAEALSLRYGWSKKPWTPEHAAENVVLHPERLWKPMSWRKPRMVFVNSMSDLFHELVPFEYIDRVFHTMALAERHTFQVLTKRPGRMLQWSEGRDVLPNVWLGTSIENDRHTYRADLLRETPAAVRFISAEPLLGPLNTLSLQGIDWLIVGGESGHGHRPMDAAWVRALRDACSCPLCGFDRSPDCDFCSTPLYRSPAFFFKQWGGRTPKAGGRLLDGREWNEMPQRRGVAHPGASAGQAHEGSSDLSVV